MNAKFYIITRLNADCFPNRPHLHKNNLNDDWLRARLKLLVEYCGPSVFNQSYGDFAYMVWCHPNTPAWLRFELAEMEGVRPIYVDRIEDAVWLHDPEVDIIVTTRLDSDDLIHANFMSHVANNLEGFIESKRKREVYAFQHGFRYRSTAGPRGTMHHAVQINAPFLTLFADIREDKENALIYCERHTRITMKYPTVVNRKLTAWISVVHDDQIATTGVGIRALADITKTFKEFGVKK